MTTEQDKATAELPECGMSYEARVKDMRIVSPSGADSPEYKCGFAHAKTDDAEIAREADAEIKELRAENKRLREALKSLVPIVQGPAMLYPMSPEEHERYDISGSLELARAALTPTNSEGAGQ